MQNLDLKNKTVFITGVAGFIGSNLAERLLKEIEGIKIVGLDNMNDYYDVRLKEYRLEKLSSSESFSFVKGNLADKEVVNSIFEKYKPELVVNLGAQAGVRYSITNPDAYIEGNLVGFYNILEGCRHYPVEHLVYTLSENGAVTRGICETNEEGYLTAVHETSNIVKTPEGAAVDNDGQLTSINAESYASMNMWGLTPEFMQTLEDGFKEFFANMGNKDILKAEYLLPIYIDELLQAGRVSVKVLDTNDKWFGVTYKEDKDYVVRSFAKLIEDAEYESTGIKKLIQLFAYLNEMVEGGIVFIDEFDSNIHDVYLCALLEYLMEYGKGQLCFTTHNVGPMDVLKHHKKSIDFLSEDHEIYSWTTSGNYSPSKLYRNGMIEGSPFNIDSIDFIGIFGSGEEDE